MANSFINLLIAMVIVYYSIYLMFVGRRINRWMWAFSALAGIWGVSTHGIYFIDKYWIDFMDSNTVRELCIKPYITVIECMTLAWIIKSGWRFHEN